MMESAIYELTADPDLRWLEVSDMEEPLVQLLQGEPLADSWRPPLVQEVMDDELPVGPLSDFPYMAGAPVFSERAAAAFGEILRQNGELLPVRSSLGSFSVFNITTVVDALDIDRSRIERFTSSGRVKRILEYVFRPQEVDDLTIFKIPQMLVPLVLVTDAFKRRTEEAELTGFHFKRLWPN